MINKRLKWKVFEVLGIPVPWVGCASHDTSQPETLRVLAHGSSTFRGVSLPASSLLEQICCLSGLLPLKGDFSSIKHLHFYSCSSSSAPPSPGNSISESQQLSPTASDS